MCLFLLIFGIINIVQGGEICKNLNVSSNLKKSKDDIISKGISSKQWNRKSKNPIIVPATQNVDYLYITSEDPNLNIENFSLDFDDHYFANSAIRLDHRQNGQHTEYAIEISYKCQEYGGALINYEMSFTVPNCGDAQIYWKKFCGNPLTLRDGFTVDMVYKNYRQEIIKNSQIINASYFDSDLDNYVFNVARDVNTLKFILSIKPEIPDENNEIHTLDTNLTQPYIEIELENITQAWFEGELQNGGLISSVESELNLQFKCLSLGASRIEVTFPFMYFKDISLIFVKDCNYANRMQNVINSKYQESDKETVAVYLIVFIIIFGLVVNLCLGRKKGLANIPCFATFISLLLCLTCQQRTCIGRLVRKKLGLTGETFLPDEPDETFTSSQKQFYGSI